MNILHTESSPGWGGQEIRILKEALGMQQRGHTVILAVQKGGGLVSPAKEAGLTVYEISFNKKESFKVLWKLISIVRKHKIDLINTHSSLDAWLGGLVAKILRKKVVRTRHLSTDVRVGINSLLLYNFLADKVVTTCSATAQKIAKQAKLKPGRALSIPTGVNPSEIVVDEREVSLFRKKLGLDECDVLAGTLCVLRGWKGISDLLQAAKMLEHVTSLKWIVIGGGVGYDHFLQERERLGLEKRVFFTGHLSPPFTALAAVDIFLLLSWAHEGVSQASLQAAYLKKPLITTKTGGLPEVCLHGKTGLVVNTHSPQEVANAALYLFEKEAVRKEMGKEAKKLVTEQFTFEMMLDRMESTYTSLTKGDYGST